MGDKKPSANEDESDRRFREVIALHHSSDSPPYILSSSSSVDHPTSTQVHHDSNHALYPELDSNVNISSHMAVRRIIVRRSLLDSSTSNFSENSNKVISTSTPQPTLSLLNQKDHLQSRASSSSQPIRSSLFFLPSQPFLASLSFGGETIEQNMPENENNKNTLFLENVFRTITQQMPTLFISSFPGRFAQTMQKLKSALSEQKIGPLLQYFNRLTSGLENLVNASTASSMIAKKLSKLHTSKFPSQQGRPQQQQQQQSFLRTQFQKPKISPQSALPSSSFPPTPSFLQVVQSPPLKPCTQDVECLPSSTTFFILVMGHCDRTLGVCVRGPRQLCGPFTLCRPIGGKATVCAKAHCTVVPA